MVEEAGGTQEQIAAAWAHDVLEDDPTFRDEAKSVLPLGVYALVCELTKVENSPGKRVKGEAFVAEIRAMSPTAELVKRCDRLNNLRDPTSGWPCFAPPSGLILLRPLHPRRRTLCLRHRMRRAWSSRS